MPKTDTARNEVIMAGIGGMGVLTAGQTLASAAARNYKHASYVPSFGFARRGGISEYTAIFCNEKIASPLLDQAHVVVLLDSSQYSAYEVRVRQGGIFIVDEADCTAERSKDDYKLYKLPGMETAVSMGSSVLIGLIMLGIYVAITECISPEHIKEELRIRYQGKQKFLERNLNAFNRGFEMGKKAK